jgi:hypothetical protein
MGEEAEKYRAAAHAAQRMAHMAENDRVKAQWLEHAAEWLRKAEEAEKAGK